MKSEQRLTRAQKNAKQKQWFKDKLDELDERAFSSSGLFERDIQGSNSSKYKKMQVHYDLFNNIIDLADFKHVTKPFGAEAGELPADFTNKDILSGKVKALLGMEMKRPFSYKIVAVNEEATTRREQAEFAKLRDYVVNSIMAPIQQELELKYQQQAKGNLSADEQRQIQEQIAQELKTMTPAEVKKYMAREHQDPAEAMAQQILEYLVQKEDIQAKFNKGWKHSLLSGEEIYWVGTVNGHPVLRVVNPMRFDYDNKTETEYIEDGEWACYEIIMTPSEVNAFFTGELSNVELDDIMEDYALSDGSIDSFQFRGDGSKSLEGIRVLHGEFKALKAVAFLTYLNPETEEEEMMIVDESYELNPEIGDISITKEWITAKYEGYKIGDDKYAFLREVPGQYKDLENLHVCKLSYMGAAVDSLNSETTSLVSRMKYYQYLYDILLYRIELLTASDKGKQLLLNMNLIPKGSGIDIHKWLYFFETTKIGWMDPNEEGNKSGTDISTAAKEIDMSLASDIQKYIALAEYTEKRCGESVGITKQIEGQIAGNEAVANTQMAIVQSTNILEPYFELHNLVKRNVLQALLETAKGAFTEFKPRYLNYVLDDMSRHMLELDFDLLENSSYGLFVSNTMKSFEALQAIQQLSHAALQNQKVELSDVIKVMRSQSIQEAEELLKVAENERLSREQEQNQMQTQAQAEAAEKEREFKREEWMHELEKIKLQEELQTEREIQKQLIMSMGFNTDKDVDKDGLPDVFEVAKFNMDAEFKRRKQNLDERKQAHQELNDKEKNILAAKKLKKEASK